MFLQFHCNFFIKYSFIEIVKFKYARINEIWCRNLEIESSYKKCAQKAGSNVFESLLWCIKCMPFQYFDL